MYKCQDYFAGVPFSDGVKEIYKILYSALGSQDWWPGDSPLEIIVGAILTQAVSWKNVEMAITNLKKEDILSVSDLNEISKNELALLIKPAGYYNMKARKLKSFINFLTEEYQGRPELMWREDLTILRGKLLAVYGIGPETADSILLYAGDFPTFVIDAYTKRIFSRVGYINKDIKYHKLKQMFETYLQSDSNVYNEYHALLVNLGKNYCKKSGPKCNLCPLIDC